MKKVTNQVINDIRTPIKILGGNNARKIIGIKNGKFCVFESSKDAERKLSICARNIRTVCHGKRKFAGGMMWFFEESNEWIKFIL